jgi:hypothetical protein
MNTWTARLIRKDRRNAGGVAGAGAGFVGTFANLFWSS